MHNHHKRNKTKIIAVKVLLKRIIMQNLQEIHKAPIINFHLKIQNYLKVKDKTIFKENSMK